MTTIEEQPNVAADTAAPDKASLITPRDRRRALFGSAVGSAVEWYDFFLYGTMSAIVFGPLFFPSDDPVASQMLALAAFAFAFAIRPIGGIIFSHIGDRIGRKRTLVITLAMMGVATVLIGFMPTYAQIGVWAPMLLTLLRLVQGLALGGEWGGGLLMAVEYSPRKKRGFYGAMPQVGALIGLALGNLAASAASSIFSEEAFLVVRLAHPVPPLGRARRDRLLDPPHRRRDPVVQGGRRVELDQARAAALDAAPPLARGAHRDRREGHRDGDVLPVRHVHRVVRREPRLRTQRGAERGAHRGRHRHSDDARRGVRSPTASAARACS